MGRRLEWRTIHEVTTEILRLVENPPIMVYAWGNADWFSTDRKRMLMAVHKIGSPYDVIAFNPEQSVGNLINSVWHEVGHTLFPYCPHWWIEVYAHKMGRYDYAGVKYGKEKGVYAERYKHKLSDLPPRNELLAMSLKRSRLLKKRRFHAK